MIRIHPLRTGSVRIRPSQRRREPGGLARVLVDTRWTEWLPIHAWAIEHPEGVIVVDTGETSRTADAGYFPAWHPYYRRGVEMDVSPDDEIGPQLQAIGIAANDVHLVVLTHFHTDHAGGLHHFPDSRILVSGREFRNARGWRGRLQGYLPNRWPQWLAPEPIELVPESLGPFAQCCPLTASGDVLVVSTPGHTPSHLSVIVRTDGTSYFLAGDASYTQDLLLETAPDGVGPRPDVARATHARIVEYASQEPTVYLPSHDPDAEVRLALGQILSRAA